MKNFLAIAALALLPAGCVANADGYDGYQPLPIFKDPAPCCQAPGANREPVEEPQPSDKDFWDKFNESKGS